VFETFSDVLFETKLTQNQPAAFFIFTIVGQL